MKPKELLRWTAVLGFGTFGLYNFAECCRVLFRRFADGDWGWVILITFLTGFMVGVPLAISYLASRREYRQLTSVVSVVAAFLVFGTLIWLPNRLGIQDFFFRQGRETPWVIISLPLSLLCLFGPFYAAAWVYRLSLRLADRYIFHEPPKERIAEQ